jgi:hypothetical protein
MPTKKSTSSSRRGKRPAASKVKRATAKPKAAKRTSRPGRTRVKQPASRRAGQAKGPAAPSGLEKLVAEARILRKKIAQAI